MKRQKIALVTGASSGIGYATAIEFAKRGYKVYACARRLERMQPLTEHGVIIETCDVTSVESVEALKQEIISNEDGYLDCLFNNAGQPCEFPAIDVTDEAFIKCFEVNVFGVIRLTREFAPLLIKANGTVAFTGSVSGILPLPFSSVYSATKAAVHSYAATLRLELKPFGVKVINVVTGGVKSDFEDKRDLPAASLYQVPGIDEALEQRRISAARTNHMSPEEYAYKVVNDFESQTLGGRLNVYRGKMATYMGYWFTWCPRFLVENHLIKMFKLQSAFASISKKYLKQ